MLIPTVSVVGVEGLGATSARPASSAPALGARGWVRGGIEGGGKVLVGTISCSDLVLLSP